MIISTSFVIVGVAFYVISERLGNGWIPALARAGAIVIIATTVTGMILK